MSVGEVTEAGPPTSGDVAALANAIVGLTMAVRALAPGSVAALVERRGRREPDDDGLRARVRAVLEEMLAVPDADGDDG